MPWVVMGLGLGFDRAVDIFGWVEIGVRMSLCLFVVTELQDGEGVTWFDGVVALLGECFRLKGYNFGGHVQRRVRDFV